MGSKPSSSSSTTSTQKLDPWLKGQISGNLNTIQNLDPYQAYPANDAIAPINPQLQQVLGQQQQMGQQGVGMLGQGAQAMQNVAGYSPQQIAMQGQMDPAMVAAGQAQSPLQISASQVNPGQMGDPSQVSASQVSAGQADLSPFQNPYQSQVVDQTINDMDRARQMAVARGEDAALSAGAFGGSRHGIADAETNRAFADRTAAAVGQLNQQGFNTALGAAQNQQGMNLQAGGMNQQAGLQGQLANQQAGMAVDQFNVGNNFQGQLANQQAGLQGQLANQQAGMATDQFNVGNNFRGQLANQQAGMAGQQFNIGTDLAAQQANQGAGLDASRLNLLGGQGLAGMGQNMFGMGQQAAQFGQNYDQGIRDFNFQQAQQAFNDPRMLAQMETAAIQGIPFMGTTSGTSTQPGGNMLGGALGGGLSGAGMGGALAGMSGGAFGGPVGMAVGGGLGLLGGMFG